MTQEEVLTKIREYASINHNKPIKYIFLSDIDEAFFTDYNYISPDLTDIKFANEYMGLHNDEEYINKKIVEVALKLEEMQPEDGSYYVRAITFTSVIEINCSVLFSFKEIYETTKLKNLTFFRGENYEEAKKNYLDTLSTRPEVFCISTNKTIKEYINTKILSLSNKVYHKWDIYQKRVTYRNLYHKYVDVFDNLAMFDNFYDSYNYSDPEIKYENLKVTSSSNSNNISIGAAISHEGKVKGVATAYSFDYGKTFVQDFWGFSGIYTTRKDIKINSVEIFGQKVNDSNSAYIYQGFLFVCVEYTGSNEKRTDILIPTTNIIGKPYKSHTGLYGQYPTWRLINSDTKLGKITISDNVLDTYYVKKVISSVIENYDEEEKKHHLKVLLLLQNKITSKYQIAAGECIIYSEVTRTINNKIRVYSYSKEFHNCIDAFATSVIKDSSINSIPFQVKEIVDNEVKYYHCNWDLSQEDSNTFINLNIQRFTSYQGNSYRETSILNKDLYMPLIYKDDTNYLSIQRDRDKLCIINIPSEYDKGDHRKNIDLSKQKEINFVAPYRNIPVSADENDFNTQIYSLAVDQYVYPNEVVHLAYADDYGVHLRSFMIKNGAPVSL